MTFRRRSMAGWSSRPGETVRSGLCRCGGLRYTIPLPSDVLLCPVSPNAMSALVRLCGISALFCIAVMAGACQSESSSAPDTTVQTYGGSVDTAAAQAASEVAAEPSTLEGTTVTVDGRISTVCQKKGCWLALDAGPSGPIRVLVPRTDDGYEFTVPTTLAAGHGHGHAPDRRTRRCHAEAPRRRRRRAGTRPGGADRGDGHSGSARRLSLVPCNAARRRRHPPPCGERCAGDARSTLKSGLLMSIPEVP
jgi:hypothetical protein